MWNQRAVLTIIPRERMPFHRRLVLTMKREGRVLCEWFDAPVRTIAPADEDFTRVPRRTPFMGDGGEGTFDMAEDWPNALDLFEVSGRKVAILGNVEPWGQNILRGHQGLGTALYRRDWVAFNWRCDAVERQARPYRALPHVRG